MERVGRALPLWWQKGRIRVSDDIVPELASADFLGRRRAFSCMNVPKDDSVAVLPYLHLFYEG